MIEIIPNWHPIFFHYTIALITIGTVSAGLIASDNVAHDVESHAAMMDHRSWALGTASTFLLLAIWAYIHRQKSKPSALFLFMLFLATGALGVTGYKGGEQVYRYGTGVMSLPDTSRTGTNRHWR